MSKGNLPVKKQSLNKGIFLKGRGGGFGWSGGARASPNLRETINLSMCADRSTDTNKVTQKN